MGKTTVAKNLIKRRHVIDGKTGKVEEVIDEEKLRERRNTKRKFGLRRRNG